MGHTTRTTEGSSSSVARKDTCREHQVLLNYQTPKHCPKREPTRQGPQRSNDCKEGYHTGTPLHRHKSWRLRYCEGWRAGATASCIVALIVLVVNASVIAWATSRYPPVGGFGVIFSGGCAEAKRMNTWLQLIINILSSTLLAASNYCMQCLSSPTRKEVDKAHSQGKILDIGIPSIQNLRSIGTDRRVLWIALALSALPLHFVSVFEEIALHGAWLTVCVGTTR